MSEGCDPLQYDRLYSFRQADNWTVADICEATLMPGENYIRLYNGSGEMKVDAIILEQIVD